MRTQTTRTIAGRVNSDGTSGGAGKDYTVRRTAVGVYTLSFPPEFRAPSVSATPALQPVYLGCSPGGGNTFTVTTLTSAGGASDQGWLFTAVGA